MFKENLFHTTGYLEKLDLFGINVNIRFCKKVLHQTKLGGIVTIFIFVLLLLQIGLVINNILDSKNPTVLYEQTYTFMPQRYNLTNDRFSLAFGVQNNMSQHYIDTSIFNIFVDLRTLTRVFNETTNDYTVKWTIRRLATEVCTKDHFQVKGTENYFTLLKYSQLYCISKNEQDIFIEGQFDATEFTSVKIYVESCNELSPNQKGVKCKSQKEITDSLSGLRFAIYYVDNTVITRDRENPFQPLGKQSFWVSHPSFYKSVNVNFRNSYLFTDNGLLVSDISEQRALTFSNDREQIALRNGDLIVDCTVLFEKSMNSNYHRSYAKLDKAVSQVGGIYQILFALGCLLCKPLSQLELNRKLMDSLFSFVNSDDKSEQDDNNHNKINTYNNNVRNNYNVTKQNQDRSLSPIITAKTQQFDEFTNNLTKSNVIIKKADTCRNITLHDDNLQLRKYSSQKKSSSQERKNAEETFSFKNSQERNCETSGDMKFSQISKLKTLFEKEKSMIQSITTTKVQSLKDSILPMGKRKEKNQNNLLLERVQSNILILKELFSQNFKEIKFRTREYILSSWAIFSFCRKRKHKLLNQSIDKLYKHIDIFYITTKLIEFEKLKHLLLGPEQLRLFEFIPRPIIEFGKKQPQENVSSILYEDNRNIFEKTVDAQESFNKIIEKGKEMSYIDKKLIEILHPKLKSLFQEGECTSNTIVPDDLTDTSMFRNEVKETLNPQQLLK